MYKFNIIEVNEKGDFIIIKYGKIYKKLELTYINNEKVENIFIEKMRDELYRKKNLNNTNEIYDESKSNINYSFDDFDEFQSNEFYYGIPCPTCSFGWSICTENDKTINSEIRKYKEVKNDCYEKKIKKKLKLKKDKNKLRKKIKKHYITSERKIKNDFKNDCYNKKFKKYLLKNFIKSEKKYKNEYEEI